MFLALPVTNRWPGIPSFKLADFGFAALDEEPDLQDTFAGTDGYTAPVRLSSCPSPSTEADGTLGDF